MFISRISPNLINSQVFVFLRRLITASSSELFIRILGSQTGKGVCPKLVMIYDALRMNHRYPSSRIGDVTLASKRRNGPTAGQQLVLNNGTEQRLCIGCCFSACRAVHFEPRYGCLLKSQYICRDQCFNVVNCSSHHDIVLDTKRIHHYESVYCHSVGVACS